MMATGDFFIILIAPNNAKERNLSKLARQLMPINIADWAIYSAMFQFYTSPPLWIRTASAASLKTSIASVVHE